MSGKDLARSVCPPVLWQALSRLRQQPSRPQRYSGRYRTYEEASRDIPASMWEHLPPDSRETSLAALTAPRRVLAWNERLLAIALMQAARTERCTFVDFGGSFGLHLSTFLKVAGKAPYSWTIIEIPSIVDEGRKRIPPGMAIRYETEIERAPRSPDLIITSGALQYLSAPYEMIARFAAMSPKYVFIDRLPVVEITDDFLTIQHVPGRYFADGERRDVPAWWFSRKGFFEALENSFVIEWTAQTGEHTEVHDIPVQLEAAMLRLR